MQSMKPVSISEFMPLSSDIKVKKEEYTKEDIQALSEMAMQRLAQIKK